MVWNHPEALFGIVAAICFTCWLAKSTRAREKSSRDVFSPKMQTRLFPESNSTLALIRYITLGVALVLSLLALADPRYGRSTETRKTFGRDIFILLDVSDSMLAEDVAPNRLTVAKLDIEDVLDAAVGDRIGLVAFAGSPQIEIPLTTDYDFFRELLRNVDTTSVKLGGTAIGDAIRLALSRFVDDDRERAIILITDGEDHDSEPLEAARQAESMNAPIFSVAIGSSNGSKIPKFDADGTKVGYKSFDGQDVVSKPDVDMLSKLATTSGGRFYFADSELDLAKIYRDELDKRRRATAHEETRIVLKRRYQPFLACALLAFFVYYLLPARRFSHLSKTTVVLICAAIFLGGFNVANADSSNSAHSPRRSKSQEIDIYNRSLELAKQDKIDDFDAIQSELSEAQSTEVRERANFNLGASAVKRVRRLAQELDSLSANIDEETSSSNQTDDPTRNSEQNDPAKQIDQYNAARRQREAARREIADEAAHASRRFFKSAQRPKNIPRAKNSADSIVVWNENFQNEEKDRELQIRSKTLADPNQRYKWLRGEIQNQLETALELSASSPTPDYYRSLLALNHNVAVEATDVDTIAKQFDERLRFALASSLNQENQGGDSSVLTQDAGALETLETARANCSRLLFEASKKFNEYNLQNGTLDLRSSRSQLELLLSATERYDELALKLADQETSINERLSKGETFKSRNSLKEYEWSRDDLATVLDELIRKGVAARTCLEERRGKDSGLESTSEQTTGEEGDDEIVFDDNETAPLNPQDEFERKIMESTQTALENEGELRELVSSAKLLSGEIGNSDDERADNLQKTQSRIAEILEEIAKPFREPNDNQNQNSDDSQNQDSNQNQDQNQNKGKNNKNDHGSQESSNQSQDQNDDQRQNSDKNEERLPDELNESPEDNQPEKEPEKSKADDSWKKPSPLEEAAVPERSQKPKTSRNEKDERQKEADALARLVERRQKEAEPQRRAIRQALKKREKSGKDW